MNTFDYENTAAYNRQQIANHFEQLRLERSTEQTQIYRPGRFERVMVHIANWMIATGKHLRRRYEVPDVNCNPTPSRHFAR